MQNGMRWFDLYDFLRDGIWTLECPSKPIRLKLIDVLLYKFAISFGQKRKRFNGNTFMRSQMKSFSNRIPDHTVYRLFIHTFLRLHILELLKWAQSNGIMSRKIFQIVPFLIFFLPWNRLTFPQMIIDFNQIGFDRRTKNLCLCAIEKYLLA